MENEIKELIAISNAIGTHADYVQGAGGNVSVKVDEKHMVIKASGVELSEINKKNGLIVVDYKKLGIFYENATESNTSEEASDEYVTTCVISRMGSDTAKPSMEAGFHVFLGKYVIHTHSVYVNILACTKEGEQLLKTICKNAGIGMLWIPHGNPGLYLALRMKKEIEEYRHTHKNIPGVIIIQNHGIVVNGPESTHVRTLHEKVQNVIKQYSELEIPFPEIKITPRGNVFESETQYLKDVIKNNYATLKEFPHTILFPDQIIFCESIGFSDEENDVNTKKVVISKSAGTIIYHVSYKEAMVVEEIIVVWCYIVAHAKTKGLSLKTLSADEVNYIRNMESEKYRRKVGAGKAGTNS